MKINRHNYEAYLLDQLEGNLSVEGQKQLQDFLLMNPDCGGELTTLEPWILEEEKITYENRNRLRKNWPGPSERLTAANFDLFSVARMEGDLSPEQDDAHRAMVNADENLANEWKDWQQARLVPGVLPYPGKEQLKHSKRKAGRMILLSIISSAAAIAMLLVLLKNQSELPEQHDYVENSNQIMPGQQGTVPDQAAGEIQVPAQAAEESAVTEWTAEEAAPVEQARTKAVNSEAPVLITESKDPDRSLETDPEEGVKPPDDLQARVIPYSSIEHASPLAETEAAPDRIEALDIGPVPIHMSSLTLAQLSELDLQEIVEVYAEENDISFWKIAGAGIRGINRLAGSDISLFASRDEEGDVDGFKLKSKRFSVSSPLGEEE